MAKVFILISLLITCSFSFAKIKDSQGYFSGRVSSFNEESKLVRFKVNFDNIKYLNKMDEIELWVQHQDNFKCTGIIVGRSSNYILVKIPKYKDCDDLSTFSIGRYYYFFSRDLVNNVAMGQELIKVLLKKRLALLGKVGKNEKLIETYMQRVDAVNSRYDILKRKLLAEWKDELARIEDDQQELVRNNEGLKIRLNEVNHKLEKYRVEDENLKLDRWALDPNYYYLK